jgi:hypothetical protein
VLVFSAFFADKISGSHSPDILFKYMDKNKSILRKRNRKFLTDVCQYII